MHFLKKLNFFLFFFCAVALVFKSTGCAKEYSFEGMAVDSALVTVPDTIVSAPFIPSCVACQSINMLPDSTWIFQVDGSVLCGTAEKALIAIERTAFTFFGPSSCSPDSGFIISVFLNEALDRDKINISAENIALYYYDKVKPSYVLISRPDGGSSLIIEKYVHATGFATGSFSGDVYTENGLRKLINGGRFSIRFNK